MFEYSAQDQLLANTLIKKGLFTKAELDQVILSNYKSMTDSHLELAGILYRIDRSKQALLIQESMSLCTLAEIKLYDSVSIGFSGLPALEQLFVDQCRAGCRAKCQVSFVQ